MKTKTVLVARKSSVGSVRSKSSKVVEPDASTTCSAPTSTTTSSGSLKKTPPVNKKTVGFVCRGVFTPQKGTVEPRMHADMRKDAPPHAQGPSKTSKSSENQPSTTSTTTAQELLDAALQLPSKDQKWLLDRLALSMQATSKKDSRDLEMWCTAVHEVLSKQMASGGYGSVLVKKTLSQRPYWDPVVEFMEHAGFQRLQVQQRQAVYCLLADVVLLQTLKVCRHRGLVPSLKFFATNAQNVAACFEDQFPGYISAGLAHMVVRSAARSPH